MIETSHNSHGVPNYNNVFGRRRVFCLFNEILQLNINSYKAAMKQIRGPKGNLKPEQKK